jgi:L-2-hydroxyglutarate oxidase LhgO
VHLTFDVGGAARLGPDAAYVPRGTSYAVDEAKGEAFVAAGRRLMPWLVPEDLSPERSGIRPKLAGPGEPARDFVIHHEADRGLVGLVSLVGIESPGLTAAPAIARRVAELLRDAGLGLR